ncbi:ecdD [Symbiodinium natans]|uniref:Hexose transporter 1 n=1 Tax=Symbiodinium natans TaxID=878477 RepID=A0A812SP24_9DINO|nr:ecdD [Symbiodinium natans]
MAPVAVAEAKKAALSTEQVADVMARAGIQEKDCEGHGGLLMVVAAAVFSSLAGLLMGLDIGYIAGVKSMASFSKDVLGGQPLTDVQDSVVTMVFGIGAAVAAFPPVMDASVTCLGRKGAVIAGGAIFCLGSAMQAVACNLALMVAGRVIAGFSVGLLSGNAPVYTSEIAPPHLRGALVTGFQFAITVGIMLAFLLALVLEDVEEPFGGWRWVIASQIVPGALLVVGGAFMPGSPRYLVAQGKNQEALQTLRALRKEDVREELAQIVQEHEAESAAGQATWGEFLSGDSRKLLCIGLSIQLLQQLCGMNAFMYDGPMIFERLFKSEHAGRLFTVVSGVVNIFATVPGLFLVDRCGRTALMKWSAIGMMLCSAVLATLGDVCFVEEEDACGDWAKWVATLTICGFIVNFAYGWGGMAWVYCAEMFPMRHRTKGVGATTDANWIGNIVIAFLPPILFSNWGFNTFWVFVGTNMLCLLCAVSLPETKDKSLEEITQMFHDWLHPTEEPENVTV